MKLYIKKDKQNFPRQASRPAWLEGYWQKVLCLLTLTCVIFIPVQLQLSAESAGEVYIKGTETGQYLAMDTEGLLYGSVSVRLTPPGSAKA